MEATLSILESNNGRNNYFLKTGISQNNSIIFQMIGRCVCKVIEIYFVLTLEGILAFREYLFPVLALVLPFFRRLIKVLFQESLNKESCIRKNQFVNSNSILRRLIFVYVNNNQFCSTSKFLILRVREQIGRASCRERV